MRKLWFVTVLCVAVWASNTSYADRDRDRGDGDRNRGNYRSSDRNTGHRHYIPKQGYNRDYWYGRDGFYNAYDPEEPYFTPYR
jgi:hypothetical protein